MRKIMDLFLLKSYEIYGVVFFRLLRIWCIIFLLMCKSTSKIFWHKFNYNTKVECWTYVWKVQCSILDEAWIFFLIFVLNIYLLVSEKLICDLCVHRIVICKLCFYNIIIPIISKHSIHSFRKRQQIFQWWIESFKSHKVDNKHHP